MHLTCNTTCSLSQYNSFFLEHKLSSEDYILELPKDSLSYISSPEIDFLKSIGGKLKKGKTKLIFRFLNEDIEEPSTKKTYGELLKDLKPIKEFAAGILVPKTFIWPMKRDEYLAPPTSLVKDAHALGLEVYASGFANDIVLSYNYSYDPSAEYLQFIDNPDFSVDGLLTDFPPTASGAVGKNYSVLELEGAKTVVHGENLIFFFNVALYST